MVDLSEYSIVYGVDLTDRYEEAVCIESDIDRVASVVPTEIANDLLFLSIEMDKPVVSDAECDDALDLL